MREISEDGRKRPKETKNGKKTLGRRRGRSAPPQAGETAPEFTGGTTPDDSLYWS
jgi:hypothetical protein